MTTLAKFDPSLVYNVETTDAAFQAFSVGATTLAVVSTALVLWQPPTDADLTSGFYERKNFSRVKSVLMLGTAFVAGKYAYDWRPEVGVAIWATLGAVGFVKLMAPSLYPI